MIVGIYGPDNARTGVHVQEATADGGSQYRWVCQTGFSYVAESDWTENRKQIVKEAKAIVRQKRGTMASGVK